MSEEQQVQPAAEGRSDAYSEWIANYLRAHQGHVRGYCQDATLKMHEAFPELTIVKGFRRPGGEHCWLVTADGTVVDPTESQFAMTALEYRSFRPGDTVCVGKCMNCGEYIYEAVQSLEGERKEFCNEQCYDEMTRWFNAGCP
jgi:hypothetical protein